jgi:hypothetical protein
VEAEIAKTLDEVWLAARAGRGTTRQRPRTPLELLQEKATKRETETERSLARTANATRPHSRSRQNTH